MSGERTEKPTPKKLKQARKEGQIGRSTDFGAWAGVLAASVLLPMALRNMMHGAEELLHTATTVITDPDRASLLALLRQGCTEAVVAVAPLTVSLLLIGVAAAIAQGGLHPATKLLVPKLSRLNPAKGIKRVFGMQTVWETVKALLKTVVLGIVLYMSIRGLLPVVLASGSLPLGVLLDAVAGAVLTLIRTAGIVGIALAAADYMVVRRRNNKQLRMSKQDIKDEHKQSDGDPHLKGAIRSRQFAMSRNRMMADVAKADVVVVNPTHVAVALRYDPARGAPRVVGKGAGVVAARIRELAAENRIPMIQDVPLARTLHKECEIGQEIPPELYGAVARVLAFVMTLTARGSAAGLHRPPALLAS